MDAQVNKRGQMMIWVIVAIVIIVSIGVLLLAGDKKKIDTFVQETYDLEPFIERCARQGVRETLQVMLPQGGFVEPRNYKEHRGKNVTYLCENVGNFEPCINQHPMLLEEIRGELKRELAARIDSCFLDMESAFEKRNMDIVLGAQTVEVSLGPGQVRVDITRPVTLRDRGTERTYGSFEATIAHPAYDLARVAMEIASQEASYCYFEYVGYMMLYPQFDIQKTTLSDATKIYTIKETSSEEVMHLAVRSCAIPPGL